MQRFNNIFSSRNKQKYLAILCIIIIVAFGIFVHTRLWIYDTTQVGKEEDIYYVWLEGKRLLSVENPYARILSGNLRQNQKYATYFPLFYIMSYLTQLLGFKDYSNWLFLWRHIFLVFNFGIASILFYTFYQHNRLLIAFFSATFWLFNRWTIYITKVAQIDFLPILFLIISLLLFNKNKWSSLLLFSLSLATKQIAIFLVPLYLIWIWQSADRKKSKEVLIALVVIFSIPLLTSLPFIFWNAEGFFKSILFSTTRNPEAHVNAPSIDAYIERAVPQFVGIKAKIPMLFLMALVYFSALQRQLGRYLSSLVTMVVFTDFNSVLFLQYMGWVTPLIPLAICDLMHNKQTNRNGLKNSR